MQMIKFWTDIAEAIHVLKVMFILHSATAISSTPNNLVSTTLVTFKIRVGLYVISVA